MSFDSIISTSFHHTQRMSKSCISWILFAPLHRVCKCGGHGVPRILFVYRVIYLLIILLSWHCCLSYLPPRLVVYYYCAFLVYVPSGLVRLPGSSYITTVALLPSCLPPSWARLPFKPIVSAYAFSVSVFRIFIVISYVCSYSYSPLSSYSSYSHVVVGVLV